MADLRGHGPARLVALLLAAILLAGSCSSADSSGSSASSPSTPTGDSGDSERSSSASGAADCSSEPGALPDGPSSQASTFEVDGLEVSLTVYPRPDHEGDPWSQWGQGLVLPDGRFVSGIGDHLGVDGNSYLFVYDSDEEKMVRFSDIASLVDHEQGSWGYGKIHAQIVPTGCETVMVASYWGTRRDISYGGSYEGDVLLRLDTTSYEVEPLGVPLAQRGIPSLASHNGLLYGEAAAPDPEAPPEVGDFFVYDPDAEEIVFRSDDDRHSGFRAILVTDDGTAYLATTSNEMLTWSPGDTELSVHDQTLPQGWLRAVTVPDADGVVYGVTSDPERFFSLAPDGTISDLGPVQDYTTSVALDPAGERLLYVPGAHGDAWEHDATVYAFDPASGESEAVVSLNTLAENELGLTLGGTYSVATDPERNRLFIGFNAGTDRESPWGEVVLAVIDLG